MTIHELDPGLMTFGPDGDRQMGETHLTATEIQLATHHAEMLGSHALGLRVDQLQETLEARTAAGATPAELDVIQKELDFVTFALRIAPRENADIEASTAVSQASTVETTEPLTAVERLVLAFRRANMAAVEKLGADPAAYAASNERVVAENLGNDLAAARVAAQKRASKA